MQGKLHRVVRQRFKGKCSCSLEQPHRHPGAPDHLPVWLVAGHCGLEGAIFPSRRIIPGSHSEYFDAFVKIPQIVSGEALISMVELDTFMTAALFLFNVTRMDYQ